MTRIRASKKGGTEVCAGLTAAAQNCTNDRPESNGLRRNPPAAMVRRVANRPVQCESTAGPNRGGGPERFECGIPSDSRFTQFQDRFLAELDARGFRVLRPDAQVAARRLAQANSRRPMLRLVNRARSGAIVLGRLSAAHTGDTVCTSSLPRKLSLQYGCRVFVVEHRCTSLVFRNNPYVSGFVKRKGVRLGHAAGGDGHIIHRLEQAFGLSMELEPRGELHLTPAERDWASEFRNRLAGSPVAVISSGCLTVSRFGVQRAGGWNAIAQALSAQYSVIQLAVTRFATLRETVIASVRKARQWRADQILSCATVLRDPRFREYIAMISCADLFVGPNSGGSHIAAALGVPAVIVLDKTKYASHRLFRRNEAYWSKEDFLYPQHTMVLA